jgi:hypothetical protein
MSLNENPKTLNHILSLYMDELRINKEIEMEIKFNTSKQAKPITQIQFNKVAERLMGYGFKLSQKSSLLRIMNEHVDQKTGRRQISNIRTELSSFSDIKKYCEKDTVDNLNYVLVLKNNSINDKVINNYDNNDYNFRASINNEINVTNSDNAKQILNTWADSKKIFRYISRSTFTHDNLPFKLDLSIVKQSLSNNRFMVPQYKFRDSGTLESPEKYEIEIELDNDKIETKYVDNNKLLEDKLKHSINIVLSGIQNSNYPISNTETTNTLNEYMKILWNDKYNNNNKIFSRNFMGPSSYTLQINNIIPNDSNSNNNNILKDYTVTDKADGDRKLLFINNKGKIFLINTNMNVEFTGVLTDNVKYFNSILDGEHIKHDKHKKYINLFAAFDLYYLNKLDVRTYGFYPSFTDDKKQFRIPLLNDLVKNIKPYNINQTNKNVLPIRIETKKFEVTSENKTIFQGCLSIIDKVNNNLLEYETDGLIFTPSKTGVGSHIIGKTTEPMKSAWDKSFKWKPSEFNTIDFLVSVDKNENNDEHIKNIFKDGTNFNSDNNIIQYKTLTLRVGFNENNHGYINPCKNMLDDESPSKNNSNNYKPVKFYPSNPPDEDAGISNIILMDTSDNNKIMLTENNEVIENNMIVEFRYDLTKPTKWRWIPIRVRYDKTADLRAGNKNFGNAYHVANSNWNSIHNPVTLDMITTGKNIPDSYENADVYYNRNSGYIGTKSLRDFHNLYVKNKLINGVSKPGMTLIDIAVGKGGDISKWINAKLSFVLGLDVSRDNIENRMDGACARYLNYKKKHNVMPKALFIQGDSSKNIKNGDAIYNDNNTKLVNALLGIGPKNNLELGKNIYNNYGIAKTGFDICSIQFAIHYMFENNKTFNNLLKNVSQLTKIGGYFIGTSYDGKQIFNLLKNVKENDFISITDENDKLIWKIIKRYNNKTFNNNNDSLGLAIDVYQESINKTFREYLVNYGHLDNTLTKYGFKMLTSNESKNIGFKTSSGLFKDLFTNLEHETTINIKNTYGQSLKMTNNEKTISFLNRYFIYKKIRNVNDETIFNSLTETEIKTINEIEPTIKPKTEIKTINEIEPTIKPKTEIKTKKKKFILKPNLIKQI